MVDIARHELLLVEQASNDHKDILNHCVKVADFFFNSIVSVQKQAYLTYPFVGQIYSHSILSILSLVRLHYTQSMLNLRIVLEATAWCSYSLVNFSDIEISITDQSSADEKNKRRMYKWLSDNYPKASSSLHERKKLISETITIHSNPLNAHRHIKINDDAMVTSFFDNPRDKDLKSGLWLVSNSLLNCTELIYRVNKDSGTMVYCNNFEITLDQLRQENILLQKKFQADGVDS